MRIQSKLFSGYLALVALVAIVAIAGLHWTTSVISEFDTNNQKFTDITTAAADIAGNVKQAEIDVIAFLMLGQAEYGASFERHIDAISTSTNNLRKLTDDSAQLEIIDRITTAMPNLRKFGRDLIGVRLKADRDGEMFETSDQAEAITTLHNEARNVRVLAVELAERATQFLNRQVLITTAVEANGFVRRSAGHLLLYLANHDPVDRQKFVDRYSSMQRNLKELEANIKGQGNKLAIYNAVNDSARFLSAGRELIVLHDDEMLAKGRFDYAANARQIRAFNDLSNNISRQLVIATRQLAQRVNARQNTISRQAAEVQRITLMTLAVVVVAALLLGAAITRHLVRPLVDLRATAERINRREQSIEFPSFADTDDEFATLGAAMRQMHERTTASIATNEYTDSVLSSMHDALLVTDATRTITSANPAACQLFQYGQDELVGKPLDLLLASYDSNELHAIMRDPVAAPGGRTRTLFRTKRGERVWVSLAISRIGGSTQSGYVYLAQDINAQIAAEESLELMQFAVDRSNDSIYWLDPNARVVYANQAACKRLGYTQQEMLRLTIHDIDPEFKPALWSRHWEELQRIKSHTVEVNHRTKSGDLFPVEITDTFLEYQGKQYTCVIGRDMTERLRIEEQTRLLRFSIDRVGDSAFWLDPAGRILYANIAARQRLGYDLDEFCKMTVFDVDTEFSPAQWRVHWQELKAKRMDTVHTYHRTRDGEVFPVEVLVNFFEYGGKEYNCAFARDISERQQQQRELESAREAAEEANRAKSSFLANLSHEFRTPLSSIVGMTGLMLEGDLDSEQLDYATTVRNSADALLTLINDLIDLAKIEAGNLSILPATFAPQGLLRESMALLQAQASALEVEFIANCHQNVPTEIVADNDRLRQVITNLLGNAVKYSGSKSVYLDLRLTQSKAGADCLRCEVRDNGSGIETADQVRIFDKFYQTSGANQQSGAGLGLAIAKQLIDLMGGTINVASRRGHGATFWFEVPITILEPASPPTERLRKNVLMVSAHDELADAIKNCVAEYGGAAEGIADSTELTRLLGATRRDLEFHHAVIDAQSLWSEPELIARKIRSAWPECSLLILNAVGSAQTPPASESALPAQRLARPFLLGDVVERLMAPEVQPVAAQLTPLHSAATVGRLILVVEDNPVNQKVALRMLEKLGCDVDLAGNGIEALERLNRRDYDMVLMDCQMPRLDGYDTTREIRRLEGGAKHTRIIAMTAHAMQGDRERCIAAGMDEYLPKPIKLSDLKMLLEKFERENQPVASAN